MTYVTCPTMRYHPAVVAQKAATIGCSATAGSRSGSGGGEPQRARGRPRLAAGERPARDARRGGRHHPRAASTAATSTTSARTSGSTRRSCGTSPSDGYRSASRSPATSRSRRFAPLADHLIAVEPEADLVDRWDAAEGRESRKIGQLPICWDPDRDGAIERAHEQFRWFGGGWKVNAELPGPAGSPAPPSSCGPRTSRTHPVRPGRRRDRGRRTRVRGGRVHRRGPGPDRRRRAGRLPRDGARLSCCPRCGAEARAECVGSLRKSIADARVQPGHCSFRCGH